MNAAAAPWGVLERKAQKRSGEEYEQEVYERQLHSACGRRNGGPARVGPWGGGAEREGDGWAGARVRSDRQRRRESLSGVREGGTFFVGPMHFGGVGGVGSESAMAAIWSSVRGEEHENGRSESTY